MDPLRRDLTQISRCGSEVAHLVTKGRQAFLADTMDAALLRTAGEGLLIRLATLTGRLPDDFRARRPQVDWEGLALLGGLDARPDSLINADLLWVTLACRVPDLLVNLGLDPSRSAVIGGGQTAMGGLSR